MNLHTNTVLRVALCPRITTQHVNTQSLTHTSSPISTSSVVHQGTGVRERYLSLSLSLYNYISVFLVSVCLHVPGPQTVDLMPVCSRAGTLFMAPSIFAENTSQSRSKRLKANLSDTWGRWHRIKDATVSSSVLQLGPQFEWPQVPMIIETVSYSTSLQMSLFAFVKWHFILRFHTQRLF
jgi:hypothetical protein